MQAMAKLREMLDRFTPEELDAAKRRSTSFYGRLHQSSAVRRDGLYLQRDGTWSEQPYWVYPSAVSLADHHGVKDFELTPYRG